MISFSNIKAETLDSGTPDRSVHVTDYIIRLHNLTLRTKNWKLMYGITGNGLEGYTDADGSSQEHCHTILC